MNRTSQEIKRDIFEWAKHHLDIRTSDEWGYDTLDADPLVHLLIGACAAEAKSVYDSIMESDERLQQKLLRYLLPEAFQYPQPACGIIKAQPTATLCQLGTHQAFRARNGEKTFSFTPLFDTVLLGGTVRFVGLNSRIIEVRPGSPYFSNTDTEEVFKLLIGIETKQKINSLEHIAFYFDWAGSSLERQAFLLALSNSRWTCNGTALNHRVGLDPGSGFLAEQLGSETRLIRRISAQYRLNFHVITDESLATPAEASVQEVLDAWMNDQILVSDKEKTAKENWSNIKGNFTWLQIDLPYPLSLTDVERNLVIGLNHFPVVNRQLVPKADDETYFLQSLGFEVVSIQPEQGHFCGIHSVLNRQTGEEIHPQIFSKLLKQDDHKLGYSLRYGGTGRLDNYNAWERLSYLLSVFRQEHRERETIENLGVKLTLEELHEAIGKRISKIHSPKAAQGHSPTVYVFVKLGSIRQLDTEIQYWVTDGDEANDIHPGTMLYAEPPIAGLDPASPKFVSGTKGGKSNISETEQTQILQDALFRRERIVTAHDIKSLCRKIMDERLLEVTIQAFFETDMTVNGGIRRAIGVYLKVAKPDDAHNHQLAQELEWTLQENSVGTIPYRVKIC